jgi:hypothetical protein
LDKEICERNGLFPTTFLPPDVEEMNECLASLENGDESEDNSQKSRKGVYHPPVEMPLDRERRDVLIHSIKLKQPYLRKKASNS